MRQIFTKERIKSRGIAGTIKHIFGVKILRTWGLGSMGGDDYIARLPAYKNPLQSIFCQDGKYHNVYLIYVQSYHLLMLFWIGEYSDSGKTDRECCSYLSLGLGSIFMYMGV